MQMIPVSSTHLSAVGFDTSDSSLVANFKNGTVYRYSGVPHSLFDALLNASSKGAFFNSNIRDRFPLVRLA